MFSKWRSEEAIVDEWGDEIDLEEVYEEEEEDGDIILEALEMGHRDKYRRDGALE
jgi:hypothetical protein